MTDDELDAYLAAAVRELEEKQDRLMKDYGLGSNDRFFVDFEKGVLTFFKFDRPVVEAAIFPIATHVPGKNSLKWAWANEVFPESVRDEALAVRQLYYVTGLEHFNEEMVECDEQMAWDFTALACKHLDAVGAYRSGEGRIRAYMLMRSIKHLSF